MLLSSNPRKDKSFPLVRSSLVSDGSGIFFFFQIFVFSLFSHSAGPESGVKSEMKTGHGTLLGRVLLQSRPGQAGGWAKTMLVFTSVLF